MDAPIGSHRIRDAVLGFFERHRRESYEDYVNRIYGNKYAEDLLSGGMDRFEAFDSAYEDEVPYGLVSLYMFAKFGVLAVGCTAKRLYNLYRESALRAESAGDFVPELWHTGQHRGSVL